MKLIKVINNETAASYILKYENQDIKIDDYILIETTRGTELCVITTIYEQEKIEDNKLSKFKKVASKKDIEFNKKIISDADKTIFKAKEIVQKYKLGMNIISANYTFDKRQLMFQFTADERVDFRNLAKELASIFKCRIELRQIGIRDKAKCTGGIGSCGRKLCCANHLTTMENVSINMAKNQSLALNPSKINGCCGRLLCCLRYEDDNYKTMRKKLPNVGQFIKTEQGEGRVVAVKICEGKYKVDIPNVGVVEISEENNGSSK